MPGRCYLVRPVSEVAEALGRTSGGLNEPPRRNIAPGQEVLVATSDQTLAKMRWGIIPVGRVNARGRPVMETMINARSETVFAKSAFEGVRRCLVPADGWYEWTGERRKKTAWDISLSSGALCVFAGIYDIWTAPGGREVAQVATLTCAPNADLVDIHHRMGVILSPDAFDTWLTGTESEAADLLVPLPNGQLNIKQATGVDWEGA